CSPFSMLANTTQDLSIRCDMLCQLSRPCKVARSAAADRLAQLIKGLPHDIAEHQQHEGPKECRTPVRNLEERARHLDDPGNQRHRGTERPREAPEDDRPHPPFI